MGRLFSLVAATAMLGCGSDPPAASADAGVPPPPPGCAVAEVLQADGSCLRPGVDVCADGFASDDAGGCAAILPPAPCAPGELALPGEQACHRVAACGEAPWGDIPRDATTQHVDESYVGADSDGTESKPFKTIADAVAAAEDGAIVAIAEGTYEEDVRLDDKPIRIWGRCPDLVEVRGSAAAVGAFDVRKLASTSEIHTLAVTGDSYGIACSGALDVLVDRVWLHDLARGGMDVEATLGPARLSLVGSLVEQVSGYGLFAQGVELSVEGSVVREVGPSAAATGRGINVQLDPDTAVPANVTVRRTVVDRATEGGIYVAGAILLLEESVVMDTQPGAGGKFGRGLEIEHYPPKDARSTVTIRSSVVERSFDVGIGAAGSDLTIERTVVRDVAPASASQKAGRCGGMQDGTGAGTLAIVASLFERCHDVGLFIAGSDATLDRVLVRDVRAQPSDMTGGRGVDAQFGQVVPTAHVTMRDSRVELVHDEGIVFIGAHGALTNVHVRATAPRPSDGLYGDGIAVVAQGGPASVVVTSCLVESSARAGIASFGATAAVSGTRLECNPIALDGEAYGDATFSFDDAGGNSCGCGDTTEPCAILTSSLVPPSPL